MKALIAFFEKHFAAAALFMGKVSANSPSFVLYHQPRVPEKLNKFKRS